MLESKGYTVRGPYGDLQFIYTLLFTGWSANYCCIIQGFLMFLLILICFFDRVSLAGTPIEQ